MKQFILKEPTVSQQ